MKNLSSIVSGSGILKSHEEFMERLADLMNEYGFDSVYADVNGGVVVFDNSNDGRVSATEGLAFGTLRDNIFHGVNSFFSYNNTSPAEYSRQRISEEQGVEESESENIPDEGDVVSEEPVSEEEILERIKTDKKKQSKTGRTWGQSGA